MEISKDRSDKDVSILLTIDLMYGRSMEISEERLG